MLHAVVRRPSVPSEFPKILVLLHGLGADEQDLIGLAPNLDPTLFVVSVRAPHSYGSGYAWFSVEWNANGIHPNGEQALESRELLLDTLASLPEDLGVPNSDIIMGGFSQGAMMSLGVALIRPDLVKGVVLMSGRLMPEFVPVSAPSELSEVPFLVQHGISDAVLPIEGSRDIRNKLKGYGCDVTYIEYPMAHTISQESLEDIHEWITEKFLAGPAIP